MLVSTKGRYALRVLVDLARHQGDGRVPLKEVAERQGISEKYLENILAVLVRDNLLSGMRGKGGGGFAAYRGNHRAGGLFGKRLSHLPACRGLSHAPALG